MLVDASDGQIELPDGVRARHGDRFHLVEHGDRLLLLPIADDPLEALREEFEGVASSPEELRERARRGVDPDDECRDATSSDPNGHTEPRR